ncbi:MAG: hypothetical protein RMJ37_02130 [Spirochaetia bacterium]|nr:hypothetical protein [Spirochaetota bacterium]MCX8097107.1 hypothetical protein [Spirochaetota bacterium]MDW8112123.1 hypothetical protein [Spirochaetia bacterium]
MSYTPLDIKTVIFADNILMKNSINNPGYASLLQSQARVIMKEKADIEQNRTTDIVEISRESEKIRRKNLGESNTKRIKYISRKQKEEQNLKENESLVESQKGNSIDIIA